MISPYHDFRFESRDVLADVGELGLDGRDVGHQVDHGRVEVARQLHLRLDRQDGAGQPVREEKELVMMSIKLSLGEGLVVRTDAHDRVVKGSVLFHRNLLN